MTSGFRRATLSYLLGIVCLGAAVAAGPHQTADSRTATAPALTDQQIEAFLKKARIVRTKPAAKGITGSLRTTLTDGVITHDAHVQTVDITKDRFEGTAGDELNFRDSWKLNVAAYRVDRLIGLNMVPVSVPRLSGSTEAAYTWWVDDVLMDEAERQKQKLAPRDITRWNQQMRLMRLFDQLIYNVDRNLGNLLITKDWQLVPIDHTRSFRRHTTLKKPENIVGCDRQVLEGLKRLEHEPLKKLLRDYLSDVEIKALLARRDAIVKILETLGPSAIFDR
jgi:hypothetical protein